MAVNNNTILAKAWLQGSNDFQQRIPDPTQAGMKATVKALLDPMNRQYYNQFIDTLVNRIGKTIVRSKRWENRLAAFKGDSLYYGTTIQEIAPKWITAHSYTDYDDTLLKLARPEAQSWYHSVNRQDRYDISINDIELRRAFVNEYGLNDFINSVMDVPYNSDAWDEYLCMRELISFYEREFGFFKINLSAAPTDEATGKEMLRKVRTYAGKLEFPSTLYNASVIEDIPVFAKQDELVLITTPEVEAALDVETLASVFNLDKADLKYRTVIIDEFPIPDAQAILTTADWFVVHDLVYETTSFYNPQNLSTNYYLHHHEIVSCSPFVPAILFTTAAGSEVKAIVEDVADGKLTITADAATVEAGGTLQLFTNLSGTITDNDEGIKVAPDAATFEITVDKGELNSRTYVDRNNVLHVQKSLESGAVLSLVATSTYANPSGDTPSIVSEAFAVTIA
jgi:hypothetical protein